MNAAKYRIILEKDLLLDRECWLGKSKSWSKTTTQFYQDRLNRTLNLLSKQTRPNLSSFALTGENMVSSLSTHSKTQTLWLLSKMIYRDLYNLLTTVKKCEGENNLYILRELLWERTDQNAKCRLALGWWSRCQPSLKYRQMRTCCNSSATGLWAHCEAGSLIELWVWFPLETLTYKTEPVLLPSTARWLTLTNHQMRTDREKQGDLMMEQTKSTSAAVENWCRRRNTNVLGCRPRKKRGTKSNCL